LTAPAAAPGEAGVVADDFDFVEMFAERAREMAAQLEAV